MPDTSILWFDQLTIADIPRVGGKNASLGEMPRSLSDKGIHMAPGFATNVRLRALAP